MFTLIQSKSASTTNALTLSVTMDSSTTAGSGIIFAVSANGTVSGVTDSQSNTYVLVEQLTSQCGLWACYGVPAAALTVTVTVTSVGQSYIQILAREYSDIAALDVENDISYSTNSPTVSTSTPSSQADALVIGAVTYSSTASASLGTGFSNLSTVSTPFSSRLSIENKVVTSAGVQTATFSMSTFFGTAAGQIGVFVFRAALPTVGIRFRKPVSGGVRIRGNVRIRQ